MHGDALLRIDILVLLRNDKGMMAASGEDSSHERLLHLRHLGTVILQERFVPDGPRSIEISLPTKTAVGFVVFAPVILLKTCAACKSLETHRAALGTMEEGCLIALANQQRGEATDLVHRCRCQEERLDKHRNAAQDGGHAIDRLSSITVGIFESDALADERVDTGSIALIATVLECAVQGSDILTTKALDNEYHHILLDHWHGVDRHMDRTIDSFQLLFVGKIVGYDEDILANGTIEREGGIQHQGGLNRTVGILVGIGGGDGTYSGSKATTNACHHKWGQRQ